MICTATQLCKPPAQRTCTGRWGGVCKPQAPQLMLSLNIPVYQLQPGSGNLRSPAHGTPNLPARILQSSAFQRPVNPTLTQPRAMAQTHNRSQKTAVGASDVGTSDVFAGCCRGACSEEPRISWVCLRCFTQRSAIAFGIVSSTRLVNTRKMQEGECANQLKERLFDQALARIPYAFGGHWHSVPQSVISDVQPLVKSSF